MSAVTAVPLRPLARGSVLRLWIALGLLVLIAAGLAWWSTSGLQRSAMPSGVQYQVIREGDGELISSADIVLVQFVGRHESGAVFADTRREAQPLRATTDNFLPGVGDGLKLMRKGSVYRFWVPPAVWRTQAGANVPFDPHETLSFDVQIVDVQIGAAAQQRIQQMQELQRQMQSGGNSVAPAPGGNAAAPAPAPIPAR
jgi:FKBP-type peptidyl-prolyl cis-trans isomerase FkpA